MANLANADITFTPKDGGTRIVGRQRVVVGRMSIGDGAKFYPSGGITPLPSKFGMYKYIDAIAVQEPGAGGILWSYSRTNDKLKAFTLTKDTPFLVVEEAQAYSTAGVVDPLSYIPAYILAIHDEAGLLYDVIPSTKTPLANEAKVNFATGVITLGNKTAVGTVKVTYIPADDTGLWSTGNISIEESVVVAAGGVDAAGVAVQAVYNSTDGVILTPTGDDQAVSSSQFALAALGANGFTRIAVNTGLNGKTLIMTYVKTDGLDVTKFPYVNTATINLAAQLIDWKGTPGYLGLVVPTLGTRVVGLDASVAHSIRLGGPSLTAANGKARWDPQLNKITTAETVAMVSLRMPLLLQSEEFRSVESSRELRVTEAPSLTAVDVVITGW